MLQVIAKCHIHLISISVQDELYHQVQILNEGHGRGFLFILLCYHPVVLQVGRIGALAEEGRIDGRKD